MKKKLIFLLSVLIIITIALTGCNWFSWGLLNVFDPEAQIRVSCSDITEGTISLEVYSLNKVEFIGEGFSYKYYSNGVLIQDLSKTVGATFYVAPSTSPGSPGPITTIDLLIYYQEVQDYMTSNPLVTEMTCTICLIGTDGAGHNILKSVTVDLPVIQPEPEPDEILQAKVEIVSWEQGYDIVTIYYEIENTGNIDIDFYEVWFTIKCTDDSEYIGWDADWDVKVGEKKMGSCIKVIEGKTVTSVSIKSSDLN